MCVYNTFAIGLSESHTHSAGEALRMNMQMLISDVYVGLTC